MIRARDQRTHTYIYMSPLIFSAPPHRHTRGEGNYMMCVRVNWWEERVCGLWLLVGYWVHVHAGNNVLEKAATKPRRRRKWYIFGRTTAADIFTNWYLFSLIIWFKLNISCPFFPSSSLHFLTACPFHQALFFRAPLISVVTILPIPQSTLKWVPSMNLLTPSYLLNSQIN